MDIVVIMVQGKEILFRVLRHEAAPRVPWVPFTGIHAGKFKGYTATEIYTDGTKLLECLVQTNKAYTPDGQPVMFDLQVEAEILGCELRWADKAPPSVASHPLDGTGEVPVRLPGKDEGRIPLVLDVMSRFKATVGETTALFGLVTGPLTLASHLRGTSLFVDLIRNKDYAARLLDSCTSVAATMAGYYIDAGMDIIAIVDPVVSQVSARHFTTYLASPFTTLFSLVRDRGVFSSFFVCGDATRNIEAMCATRPDSIFIDENIAMAEAKVITDRHGIVLGGNVPLTSLMLYGTQQDNMKYVLGLLDSLSHENLVIAPGCDMPYDVPFENVIGIQQAVTETEAVRKTLANYQAVEEAIPVDIPDYTSLPRPLVEVFTLDSDVCAACGYMRDAALDAKAHFGDGIDVVEYKAIYKENIARIKKMGLVHLPAIVINGVLKYSSLIPDRDALFSEIHAVLP